MYNYTEWTNNEASRTKLSLSEHGYLDDPFVGLFCNHPLKKAPEINRGYFARVYSIAHSVKQFCLKGGARSQIVNLGSGYDTLFWRLKSKPAIQFARYVDVDSCEVVDHKIRSILKHENLLNACGGNVQHPNSRQFHSDNYHCIAQDATKAINLTKRLIEECHIQKSDPILFVFECVLLYWEEEATSNLFCTLNRTFENCNFAIFDLVNTKDKFSHLMQESLNEQHTPLLGAVACETIDDWRRHLKQFGCKHINTWIMNEVYDKLIPIEERNRIEKLEFFDEVELLLQLFNHYCLVLASNSFDFTW